MAIGQRWGFHSIDGDYIIVEVLNDKYCRVLQVIKGTWRVGIDMVLPYPTEVMISSHDEINYPSDRNVWIYLEGQDK